MHRRSCRSEGAPGRCVQARFPVSTFHLAAVPILNLKGVSAINTPHPTHVDLEGMALRALSGAVVGRSGRKGKWDCRGCQKELHRGSGRQPMVACSCCWMLGAIRNMALVALALRLSGQRMQCVGWGCRSAESAHAYRTQLAHTAPTTIP